MARSSFSFPIPIPITYARWEFPTSVFPFPTPYGGWDGKRGKIRLVSHLKFPLDFPSRTTRKQQSAGNVEELHAASGLLEHLAVWPIWGDKAL